MIPNGYRPLEDALNDSGRAEFGDAWVGKELTARSVTAIEAEKSKAVDSAKHRLQMLRYPPPGVIMSHGERVSEIERAKVELACLTIEATLPLTQAEQEEGEAFTRCQAVWKPFQRQLYDNSQPAFCIDPDGRVFAQPAHRWGAPDRNQPPTGQGFLVPVSPTPTWADLTKACSGKLPDRFREDLPNVLMGYEAVAAQTVQDASKAARQILDGTKGLETTDVKRLRKSIRWLEQQPAAVVDICRRLAKS